MDNATNITISLLEAGCSISTFAGSMTFHGTIAAISADNPANCSLGGFKESASAHRHCRQCSGTRSETQVEVHVHAQILIININIILNYHFYSFVKKNLLYEDLMITTRTVIWWKVIMQSVFNGG